MREGKTPLQPVAPRASLASAEGDAESEKLAHAGALPYDPNLQLISGASTQFSYSNDAILTSVLLGISRESAEDALRTMRHRKDDPR